MSDEEFQEVMKLPERELALGHLDYARELVVNLCAHLTDEQARTKLVASKTTPMGIIRHLIAVEQFWFRYVLTGGAAADDWVNDPDDDPDWDVDGLSLQALINTYKSTCAESNSLIGNVDFSAIAVREWKDVFVSLRWIVLHMIHETAQHCGHLDILIEQIEELFPE